MFNEIRLISDGTVQPGFLTLAVARQRAINVNALNHVVICDNLILVSHSKAQYFAYDF